MKHLKIAATADGGLIIEGYGVPFGGPIKGKDLHGQYFSKKTDFALDLIPDGQRPLLFQHGLDSAVDTAVIGRWGVKKIDDGGVWVRAQLDARSEYINEIKELVDNDALGFSSGTMGHLVKVSSKTGEILKWALVELSLTPNPANPNAYIVRANKSAAAHVKSLFATKHGDHDQSEHGNWATGGGGNDKESRDARASSEREMSRRDDPKWQEKFGDKGERGKHDPQLSKAAWHGMQNIAVDATNIQKYTSTVGDYARQMADDMNGDGNSGAAAAWERVARYADEIGGTAVTVEEYVRDNPHGESARQIVNSIDQGAQTMDQARSAFNEALDTAQKNSPGSTQPDEVNNALLKLSGSLTALVYNSGMVTQQQSSAFTGSSNGPDDKFNDYMSGYDVPGFPKTLRIKRSTKHGDHDQSEHGNRDGAGAGAADDKGGNNGPSQEMQTAAGKLAMQAEKMETDYEELNTVNGLVVTIGGEERTVLEFNTAEGDASGMNYYQLVSGEIAGTPGPDNAMVELTEDETYGTQDSQELRDYLASRISGEPQDKVDAAYEKLVRLADANYKEQNDTDEGVLDLEMLLG